jgi:hypothetical protein
MRFTTRQMLPIHFRIGSIINRIPLPTAATLTRRRRISSSSEGIRQSTKSWLAGAVQAISQSPMNPVGPDAVHHDPTQQSVDPMSQIRHHTTNPASDADVLRHPASSRYVSGLPQLTSGRGPRAQFPLPLVAGVNHSFSVSLIRTAL